MKNKKYTVLTWTSRAIVVRHIYARNIDEAAEMALEIQRKRLKSSKYLDDPRWQVMPGHAMSM